jgi:predicted transcriptional regulator
MKSVVSVTIDVEVEHNPFRAKGHEKVLQELEIINRAYNAVCFNGGDRIKEIEKRAEMRKP